MTLFASFLFINKIMATRNQTAGHNYERDIVKEFKKAGFPHVVTSRVESRSRDDQGIDFINRDEHIRGRLPFNVQSKTLTDYEIASGRTEKVKYREILASIPFSEGIIPVFLHRHTVPKHGKFWKEGEYAFMYQRDFFTLIEATNNAKRYEEAFNAVMCYFDSISEEEQPKLLKQLKKLGL